MKMLKAWLNNRRARKLHRLRRKAAALEILSYAVIPREAQKLRRRIVNISADMLELEHKLKIHYRTNDIASF